MKILVLGGTGWVGSHIARIALEHGHAVTCLSRGTEATRARLANGARFIAADRDDDDALASVRGEHWDAVVDVSSQPSHVRRAVRDVTSERYVFISTVSVYASNSDAGADESAELLPALNLDSFESAADYGSAKVACEDAVRAVFGEDKTIIIRPGLIGGPGDATGRTTYWPWRFAHPATADVIAAPDALGLTTAIIDARDLAAFVVHCIRTGASGTFNALGEQISLAEHLAVAREVGVAEGGAGVDEPRVLPIDVEFLQSQGVGQWSGESSMPLWIADPAYAAMSERSTVAAFAAGLRLRQLADTLRDGMWWRSNNGGAAGLSDAAENALIKAWRANGANEADGASSGEVSGITGEPETE